MSIRLPSAVDAPRAARVDPDLRYRPDVDGLRAVAVVAVVLFHAEMAVFAGGYVGVDVFFVISGYLITQRVVAAVEQGRFDGRDFYRRRVRRLLPAASATVIATLVAGLVVLPVYRLRDLGLSALSASTSWSNVLFWTQSGYWDAEALTKPLLHTWSLSVEEQFYLVWPMTLLLLVRRLGRRAIGPILALGAVSVMVTTALTPAVPTAAFYLTPFRAYEFVIGAGCVWVDRHAWPSTAGADRLRALLFAGGLAAILWSVFAFDAATLFPGAAALVPTLGTAAVILAREPVGVARLLVNRPSLWVGRASYSLYLVHWPLLVLADHVTGSLSSRTLAVVLPASVVLAGLQHRHVEERFRVRSGPCADRPLRARPAVVVAVSTALAGVVLVVVAPALVHAGHGEVVEIAARPLDEVNQDRTRARYLLCQEHPQGPVCGRPVDDARNVFVLGDSQGPGALNALRVAAPLDNHLISDEGGCPPLLDVSDVAYRDPACASFNDRRLAAVRAMADDLDLVVLAMRLQPDRADELVDTIAMLQGLGLQVAVMGVGPEYDRPAWEVVLDHGRREGLDAALAAELRPGRFELDERYADLVRDAGATYLPRLDVLCPQRGCPAVASGSDALVIHDNTHMTLSAAQWLGRALRRDVPELFPR